MKGYYIGRCEECWKVRAATSIGADRLDEVAEDVADMIRAGLVVTRYGRRITVRMEDHSTDCKRRKR